MEEISLLTKIRYYEEDIEDLVVISEEEIARQNAKLLRVKLTYKDETIIDIPVVLYDNGEWFSPYDWCEDFDDLTTVNIDDHRWVYEESNREAIMLGGLPRFL